MIGARYLEHGRPVIVLAQWRTRHPAVADTSMVWHRAPRSAPRNVLIKRDDDSLVIRPFRGLRRPPSTSKDAS